jgi:Zn-dependent protease
MSGECLKHRERTKAVKYSWTLGRLCGIDVYLHWSFLIVPAWVVLSSLAAGASVVSAFHATFFVLAVFGCVLLHELGHALMARRYGIATRDITLLPIGGLARLERMPRNPFQELAIALAGPAVNLAIAGSIGLGLWIGGANQLLGLVPAGGSFLTNLLAINLGLAIFNLLPAFPMDGGRVLRSLLAMWVSYGRATQIAAAVGQGLAFCLAVLGLMGSWNLLLVALFVFVAARSEAEAVAGETKLEEPPARDAAAANAVVLLPAHARADEVANVLFSQQSYFPVIQGGEVVGVLSKVMLLKALANAQGDRLVAELMTESCRPHSSAACAVGALRPACTEQPTNCAAG